MIAHQRKVTMYLDLVTVWKLDHRYIQSYLQFLYAVGSKGSLLLVICKRRSYKYALTRGIEMYNVFCGTTTTKIN